MSIAHHQGKGKEKTLELLSGMEKKSWKQFSDTIDVLLVHNGKATPALCREEREGRFLSHEIRLRD